MGVPTNMESVTTRSTNSGFRMFRRTRSREREHGFKLAHAELKTPSKANNASHSRTTQQQARSFLSRLLGSHNNGRGKQQNRRRRRAGVQSPSAVGRPSIRKSTSTFLTERTTGGRSSAFMAFDTTTNHPILEPCTMSQFLLAEEIAALDADVEKEEEKQEISSHSGDDRDAAPVQTHRQPQSIMKECVACTAPQHAPEMSYEMKKNEHAELGNLQFEFQTLPEAKAESYKRQRPILCIEAQIPGDVTTGQTIFSHPLIVEAVESLFVTVQPRQCEPHEDDKHQDRFFFRSSCRTRVRILDDMGIDVLPPVERMTSAEVVAAMVRGLESYRISVPKYLRILLEEESGKMQVITKTRVREIQAQAFVGVFDTAPAEVELAGLDGVLSTRSGVLVRQNVVQVTYDSRRLSYSALVRHALRRTRANVIYFETNEERIAAQMEVQHHKDFRRIQQRYGEGGNGSGNDKSQIPTVGVVQFFGHLRACQNPKPGLRGSILRFVPLSDLQATRANRLISLNKFDEAMHLLSPRQGLIAMQTLRAHHSKPFHDVVGVPIEAAWNDLTSSSSSGRDMATFHDSSDWGGQDYDDGCSLDSEESKTEDPTEAYEDPYYQ